MTSETNISYTEQAECVRREIKQRQRVYPRLIASGRMTQRQADTEIARMNAVLATLEPLEAKERLL